MRLFFREAYEQVLEGGSRVSYMAGHFYIVDDAALAAELVDKGVAEGEEQHAERLAREAAPPVAEPEPAPAPQA